MGSLGGAFAALICGPTGRPDAAPAGRVIRPRSVGECWLGRDCNVQPVPALVGNKHLAVCRVGFDLLAKAIDVSLQGMSSHPRIIPPDPVQQYRTRYSFCTCSIQEFQDTHLLVSQTESTPGSVSQQLRRWVE